MTSSRVTMISPAENEKSAVITGPLNDESVIMEGGPELIADELAKTKAALAAITLALWIVSWDTPATEARDSRVLPCEDFCTGSDFPASILSFAGARTGAGCASIAAGKSSLKSKAWIRMN